MAFSTSATSNYELNNCVRNNDVQRLRQLVDTGADLTSTNGEPWHHTPLHQACYWNQIDMVRELLDLGAYEHCAHMPSNPCAHWFDGSSGTPIQLARGGGHIEIVHMLEKYASEHDSIPLIRLQLAGVTHNTDPKRVKIGAIAPKVVACEEFRGRKRRAFVEANVKLKEERDTDEEEDGAVSKKTALSQHHINMHGVFHSDMNHYPPVGTRLRVFWEGDKRWFKGVVAQYSFENGRRIHKINYDDGDIEWLNLADECWLEVPEKKIKPMPCICGYDTPAAMARHKRTCKVIKAIQTKIVADDDETHALRRKIKLLQTENQRLRGLVKSSNIRPKMTQNRRLRLAANQQWSCNICHSTLNEVFHVDHIRPWNKSLDDSDANLYAAITPIPSFLILIFLPHSVVCRQVLCVPCHVTKTSHENSLG